MIKKKLLYKEKLLYNNLGNSKIGNLRFLSPYKDNMTMNMTIIVIYTWKILEKKRSFIMINFFNL